MSWRTQNSLKRIFEAFKRNKDRIYSQDIESLKHLNSEIENSQNKYITDNILFAKLLCITLTDGLLHYKDINSAKNRIYKQLAEPMSYHTQMLKMQLEDIDRINFFESKGFDTNLCFNENLHDEKISKIKENEADIFKKLMEVWPLEKVEKSIYTTANDLLKDLTNYA